MSLNREKIMKDWDDWREKIANGETGSGPRDSFESLLDKYDEIIEDLKEALEFYADPDSYFGILVFPDRPCGDFADDMGDDHGFNQYERPMPGKLARETIKRLEEELYIIKENKNEEIK